jgi:hypothetical protein
MKKLDQKKWILKNEFTKTLIVCRGDANYKEVTKWDESKYDQYKHRLEQCDLNWLLGVAHNLQWLDPNYTIYFEQE